MRYELLMCTDGWMVCLCRMRDFRLDVHGSPLRELGSRGVLDEKIVPVYPYRDDAVLLYKILHAYVDRNLRIFYGMCTSTSLPPLLSFLNSTPLSSTIGCS